MIYKLNNKDEETLKTLGDIWLNSNITTHNFINEQYCIHKKWRINRFLWFD